MRDYILLITMHADPAMPPGYNEWGGTHTYMKELLDGFGEKQAPCILITRKSMHHLPAVESFNDYCTIYRLTNGNNDPMNKIFLKEYHQENINKILDILSQQETLPSIIHSVYWNSGRLAMALSERLQIPFVHSIISNSRGRVERGAFEPVPERANYEQEVYIKATKLICVSNDEREDLIRLYNISPKKIIVAGQFIAPSFLIPAHNSNGFPRLNSHLALSVQSEIATTYNTAYQTEATEHYWSQKMFTYLGRMDMNKGLDHIFRAWYRLYRLYGEACPGLWLVGGSLPEIESVRLLLKHIAPELYVLERNGKILWWGYLDPEGVSTVLLKSIVLITHSMYEPGGRVAVEAMSEGIPVIATPNGFARDTIQDWREGFLVNYGDEDTLSLRMEHFIRQPYLSNALGLNAKRKAIKVIDTWDFFGRHLSCYNGSSDETSCTMETDELPNSFDKREIDYFPFNNKPYSTELLSVFFKRHIEQQVLFIEQTNRGVYTVAGEEGNYIVKRIFTRLAISPLFNPICSDEYVRRADKRYRTELTAYQRTGSTVLAGADDLHYLLLLRVLDPYQVSQKENLTECLHYLIERPNILTTEDAATFRRIVAGPSGTLPQLEEKLHRLYADLDDYYFEVSGIFSETLCWCIAPHLILHNQRSLDPDLINKLSEYVRYFSAHDIPLDEHRLRNINTDTELKHIYKFKGKIHMIDLEKASIGTIENDIAGLFFDFLMQKGDDGSFWLWAINSLNTLGIFDLWSVLSSTAYRFFYECIIRSVLDRSVPDICMRQLELLHRLSKKMLS